MRSAICRVVLSGLLLLAAGSPQAAVVNIEFDDPALPDSGFETGFITEGFAFSFGPTPIPTPPAYYTSTSGPGVVAFCPGCYMEFAAADGSTFGVTQFDAWIFGSSGALELTGFLAGGGTVSRSFAADSTAQSFTVGWEGLTGVRLANPGGDPTVLESVVVNVVPVPAAVWLFGSALVGLGWMRRR